MPSLAYDHEADRQAARSGLDLSRVEFVLRAKRAGLIDAAEAVEAAKGELPASFAAAIDDLPTNIDAEEARIIWAAATRIPRLDPILEAVARHQDLDDAALDALFAPPT